MVIKCLNKKKNELYHDMDLLHNITNGVLSIYFMQISHSEIIKFSDNVFIYTCIKNVVLI